MEILTDIVLPAVFVCVGIALVIFIIELVKTVRAAQHVITDLEPTVKKIDPLVERLQLTVDSVNLEMVRVDKILEDVSDITDSAASAVDAVDNITNAPLQAVNNVAKRVKSVFGGKQASDESVKLAEQRVAVAKALESYKNEEKKAASEGDGAFEIAEASSVEDSGEVEVSVDKKATKTKKSKKSKKDKKSKTADTAAAESGASQDDAATSHEESDDNELSKNYVQVDEDSKPAGKKNKDKTVMESPFVTKESYDD